MKLAETVMIHVVALRLFVSAVGTTSIVEGTTNNTSSDKNKKKNFDQFQACAGQDAIVLNSDADVGADPVDGWFAYSGSLIFCCAGLPYAVTCTEMMLGYCDCPLPASLSNATDSDITTSTVCYARTCGSAVVATPILFGKKKRSLHYIVCETTRCC
jgi:hypothetical protein